MENIQDIFDKDTRIYILIAMNHYGIEGTEDKIKEIYRKKPRKYMLEQYYNIIRRK